MHCDRVESQTMHLLFQGALEMQYILITCLRLSNAVISLSLSPSVMLNGYYGQTFVRKDSSENTTWQL